MKISLDKLCIKVDAIFTLTTIQKIGLKTRLGSTFSIVIEKVAPSNGWRAQSAVVAGPVLAVRTIPHSALGRKPGGLRTGQSKPLGPYCVRCFLF